MYMTDFVRDFNSKSEADVMWLKEIGQATVKTMDGTRWILLVSSTKIQSRVNPKWINHLIGRMYTFSYA